MASPITMIGSLGNSIESLCSAFSSAGRLVSTALWIIRASAVGSLCNTSRLREIREISSRSSSRRAICRTCRSIISALERSVGAATFSHNNAAAALRMGASGFRNSCASVARNSSLRRSASRSSDSARRWRISRARIACTLHHDTPTRITISTIERSAVPNELS